MHSVPEWFIWVAIGYIPVGFIYQSILLYKISKYAAYKFLVKVFPRNSGNGALTESEDLKYQLETLASYEPDDLDNPEFDVGYETTDGREGYLTVCCLDVANRALVRINELESRLTKKGIQNV